MAEVAPVAATVDFLTALRMETLRPHVRKGMKSIEIGAFTRPTLMRPEFETSFIDYYSTDELKQQCINVGANPDAVEPVDFVVRGEDYTPFVSQVYDIVIANHVLEHIRNPVLWLVMIAKLVKDGGLLFLSLPDKAFSFDRFRDETSLSHILSDYLVEGRDLESEHCIETEIFYDRKYIGGEQSLDVSLSFDNIRNAAEHFHPGIHCHVFSGNTFLSRIAKPLIYMKLIPWSIVEYVPETEAGEFHIVMQKGAPMTDLTPEEFFKGLA